MGNGAGELLTKTIASSKSSEELSIAIFALGALLRGYPYAQSQIIPKTGLSVLLNILKDDRTELFNVRLKIIRLLDDIYTHCEHTKSEEKSGKFGLLKVMGFSLNDYEQALNASIYCDATIAFIENYKTEISKDLDVALELMTHLDRTKHLCLSIWTQSALLRHLMLILRHKFGDHTDEEIKGGGVLVEHINSLFHALEFLPMQEIKDEL